MNPFRLYAIRRARAECKSVRRWLEENDSVDISEQMAYDRIENSPEWIQNSRLCAVLANTFSTNKKNTTEHFLPIKPKKSTSVVDQVLELVQSVNANMKGG